MHTDDNGHKALCPLSLSGSRGKAYIHREEQEEN
eukprot:COSAG02_NODE_58859_length_276_cov_0.581921_2_plen_33_part_01